MRVGVNTFFDCLIISFILGSIEQQNADTRISEFNETARNNYKNNRQYRDWETDRKSTRLNSSHITRSRMPSSA